MSDMKERVAAELAKRVQDGDVLGVGTGTTVDAALVAIGERIKREKLDVHVVTSSYQSAWRCQEIGLRVLGAEYNGELSWGFDGADAVDEEFRLIKGRGGALLREKVLATRCKSNVIIVDDTKLVKNIAQKCSVPIEVLPQARFVVERELPRLGARSVTLRIGTALERQFPVITESGNLLLDAKFENISNVLDAQIKAIPGVVETGLFIGLASELLVAGERAVKSFLKTSCNISTF